MELTAAQRRVVEHGAGALRVIGAAATGKTTALRARYLALTARVKASRVLAISRDRAASLAFRDEILIALRGGFDSLPVTTIHGVAHDLVSRAGGDLRLLGHREQWALVERLLTAEQLEAETLWPTLHRFVGRQAFVDEVARAVLTYRELAAGVATLLSLDERWGELAAFATRYQSALDEMGATDSPGLLGRALEVASADEFDRFDHVLVDDGHDLSVLGARLIAVLGLKATSVVVAADPSVSTRPDLDASACLDIAIADPAHEIALDQAFVDQATEQAMIARHPSIEPEAIAAVLLEAAANGVAWDDMAVLMRSPAHRGSAIIRALSRYAIPVSVSTTRPADEPAVRGIIDFLRWTAGDGLALGRVLSSPLSPLDAVAVRQIERRALAAKASLADQPELAALHDLRAELAAKTASTPPDRLAHIVFQRLLTSLVDDPDAGPPSSASSQALDAVVAFIDGLSRWSERQPDARLDHYLVSLDAPDAEPDPWRTAATRRSGVTLTSVQGATGRRWPVVVMAGCLEGELPRVSGFIPLFDPLALDPTGAAAPPSVAERRVGSLEIERRRFHLARTRATMTFVASAAPEAKDLVSRFIESWPRRAAALPPRPSRPYPTLPVTEGPAPVFPDNALVLSASQLTTFADCHLKYAFSYGLRVRGDGNVWADFGTLVHDILEKFLDPRASTPHTLDELRRLADECWTDDVAPYRPQREQLRRDLADIIELWWEDEGQHLDPSSVVAVEHPFDIQVGPHRITGKIDRVDRADGGVIEIVDYKTGRHLVSHDEIVDDIQLATYHLAATLDPALSAHGEPHRLRLLYVRKMESRDQPITGDHAQRTRDRILATAAEILTEDFVPSVDADCDHCDFHRLCPLQAEGREVASR